MGSRWRYRYGESVIEGQGKMRRSANTSSLRGLGFVFSFGAGRVRRAWMNLRRRIHKYKINITASCSSTPKMGQRREGCGVRW